MTGGERPGGAGRRDTNRRLSLYRLLDPAVLADPYPLYQRLRSEAPVHWDPFLHAWVVTRYDDVLHVLTNFSATCTPSPEQLAALGMEALAPVAEVLVRQMLFLDPPAHTRVRRLAAQAFTPKRVERLRGTSPTSSSACSTTSRIRDRWTSSPISPAPLPAIVSAEMLGLPPEDWPQLTAWSRVFAEILGNFQHDPDSVARVLRSVEEMTAYLRHAIREQAEHPRDGLLGRAGAHRGRR